MSNTSTHKLVKKLYDDLIDDLVKERTKVEREISSIMISFENGMISGSIKKSTLLSIPKKLINRQEKLSNLHDLIFENKIETINKINKILAQNIGVDEKKKSIDDIFIKCKTEYLKFKTNIFR